MTAPVKSPVNAVSGPLKDISESSDHYPYVVARLDSKTRVIAAGIQWIIQKRSREGRYPWESIYYCRSKAGLLLYAPKSAGSELLALPYWFPERKDADRNVSETLQSEKEKA